MNDTYDVVVIGSGFGGSINALRLAQDGKLVIVLERGKRYRPGDFPRDPMQTDQIFWGYPRRQNAKGLYDVRFLSGLATVVASGVGGGSLIYANIHIRPDPIVFEDERWPTGINRQMLDPYFDRVAAMLGVSPLPRECELPKRDVFRKAAEVLHRPVFDPDQAVSWEQPADPSRAACRLCAECEFGCQIGAKNTLDFTYLSAAELLGAKIQPGALVSHIEPSGKGYRVHFTDVATGDKKSVFGTRAVVSAGTLGTNEILLRSREIFKSLPRLSTRLGHGYSANGDFLGTLQNVRTELQPWEGTDVTSVIRYFDSAPQFTMAAPTFNQATMNVLASLGQPSLGILRCFAVLLWPMMNSLVPWIFKLGLLSRPSRLRAKNAGNPARMTNLFAIGRDNANGTIKLKNGRLNITWNYARENAILIDKMLSAMQEISKIYGGSFAPLLIWALFKRIVTVHSLGGCRLSENPEQGVVSSSGEVHGYPGLFVADGSVIPTSIGFHPVMTISAISEHIADAVVNSFASCQT
jgi:cholesterol oxidase